MTTINGIVGYTCDSCGVEHTCNPLCDRSSLPTGWKSKDSKDIHVCEDCDLLETVRALNDDWKV